MRSSLCPPFPKATGGVQRGRSETKTLIFGLLGVNATLFGAQKRSNLAVNTLVIQPHQRKVTSMKSNSKLRAYVLTIVILIFSTQGGVAHAAATQADVDYSTQLVQLT